MKRKLAFILATTLAFNSVAAFAADPVMDDDLVAIEAVDDLEEIEEESGDYDEEIFAADEEIYVEEGEYFEEELEEFAVIEEDASFEDDSFMDIDVEEAVEEETEEFAEDASTYQVIIDKPFIYDKTVLTEAEILASIRVIRDGNTKLSSCNKANISDSGNVGKFYIDSLTPKKTGYTGNAGEQYDVVFKLVVDAADPTKNLTIATDTIEIGKADLKDLVLTGTVSGSVVYDGTEKKPTFSKISDAALDEIPAASYEISSYKDNVNASAKAVAVISAKPDTNSFVNNYSGTAEVNFTIAKAKLGSATNIIVNKVTSVPYNGKVQNPEVDVKATFTNTYGSLVIPETDYELEYVTADSKDADSYYISIKPSKTGNLEDDASVPTKKGYEITALNLKDATVEKLADIPVGTDMTTTENLKKYLKVTLAGMELTAGTDFTATYTTDNKNKVGQASVLALAPTSTPANFTGSVSFTYTAVAKELAKTYESAASISYTGSEQRPNAATLGTVTVKGGADKLLSTEYTVTSWANNINATTGESIATATIEGKGVYEKKTATVEFAIQPKDLTGYTAAVTDIPQKNYYVGAPITGATVKVSSGSETLTLTSADYDLTASVISGGYLTGAALELKGNYSGSITVSGLNVLTNVSSLNDAVITGSIPAGLGTYNEAAIKKYITVKAGDQEIASTAYAVSDIASATTGKNLGELDSEISFKITASAEGLSGTASGKISVAKRDLSELKKDEYTITLAAGTQTYNGTEKEPAVSSVVIPGVSSNITLNADTDYTVVYTDNVNAGTATVTIVGKGNYKNTITTTFTIEKATLKATDFTIEDPEAALRGFKVGKPEDLSSKLALKAITGSKLTFTAADYTITQNASPVVVGENPAKAEVAATDAVGSTKIHYTVKINKDSKNYKEDATGFDYSYALSQRAVTEADKALTLEKPGVTYKEGTIDSAYPLATAFGKITVKVDDRELTEGTDYDLSIGGTNKVDGERSKSDTDPYVRATFKGNYSGTADVLFSITPASFDLANVKLVAPKSLEYTGSAIKATASYIGKVTPEPVEDKEYTVVYTKDGQTADPINAGTYTATVVATASYGGAKGDSISYTITKKALTKAEFETMAAKALLENVTYIGELTEKPVFKAGIPESREFEVVSYDKTWDGVSTTGKAVIALKDSSNFSYEGSYETSFTWEKVELSDLNKYYEVVEPVVYTGKELKPELKVKEGSGVSLDWITSKDYSGTPIKAGDVGSILVKVTVPTTEKIYPVGTASFTKTFTVKAADISTAKVDPIPDQVYTGSPIRPTIAVENESGIMLTAGIDYSVKYTDNTELGKASITIDGLGNYTGQKIVNFNIVEKEEIRKAKEELTKAQEAVAAAKPGTDDETKALASLKNAISNAEAAGVDETTVKAAKDAYDTADAANKEAAKTAAETAAATAKENPTAENIAAAQKAIDSAKAAGVADTDLKKAEDDKAAADTKKKADDEKKVNDAVTAANTAAETAKANPTPENIKKAEDAYQAAKAAGATDAQLAAAKAGIDSAKAASEQKNAVITPSTASVKKGKKAVVKITSDAGSKITVTAKNKNAKNKKYISKIKSGVTAKITFTKNAKKGKYKFTVKTAEKGNYKATTKVITIKVQ